MVKFLIVLLWLAGIASFIVVMPDPLGLVFNWVAIALVVVHTLEGFVFASRIMKAEGNKAWHFLQLFIFGVAHVRTLPK